MTVYFGKRNGQQPDDHMYEAAIRHWDGYWFGKRKLYGDTYPHYWSALTVNAYKEWEQITGQRPYGERAEAAYRAVLSLIHGVDSGQHDAVYFSCRGSAYTRRRHSAIIIIYNAVEVKIFLPPMMSGEESAVWRQRERTDGFL